nr:zinc finger, CCHC-type [Tanacetum cinerariifolium]
MLPEVLLCVWAGCRRAAMASRVILFGVSWVTYVINTLKLHEQTLPKSNAPALNAIRAGKVQKSNKHKKSHSQKGAKGQNQEKGKFVPKPKISPPPKRENPAKDSICH